jgi:tRNA pseudouridine38-40 synthase
MARIALGIEYDGTAFAGWQSQSHATGIQTLVEAALACVADHPVAVTAAGRTDAGVHATQQVVHFDTEAERSERGWVLGANTHLRTDVSILWARIVQPDFHARFSAVARSYRYVIRNRAARLSLDRHRACWVREPLDAPLMHVAAQSLVGTHDFSSFRAAECQSHTPIRQLETIAVTREDDLVTIDVTANAFLHHMVRNIAGVLIAVGRGKRPGGWVREVLELRDRRLGGVTAPPHGLYLVGVRYPAGYAFPAPPGALGTTLAGQRREAL